MTGTPVIGSVNTQAVNLLNTVQTISKTGSPDFKNFMNLSESASGAADKAVQQKPADKTSNEVSKEIGTNKPDRIGKAQTEDNLQSGKEVTSKDVETVKEEINAIAEEIEEEFDVTLEDIEAALSVLGLNMTALLDADRLPEIITEITGTDDLIAIATDPDLYEALENIKGTVEEALQTITEEMNIPEEDFKEALASVEREVRDTVEPLQRAIVNNSQNSEELAEKIEVTVAPKKENVTVERNIGLSNTESESTETETPAPVSLSETRNEGFKDTKNEAGGFEAGFAQRLLQNVAETFNEAAEGVTYSEVDVQDIINQMTESIRVEVTPEAHEINIKLHPESLGSVSVKISANNEGLMRAQFITQNESVKAIVESQAIVLREALESKGVTIEAVEVTVQSHEFERNLSDRNRDRNSETSGSGSKRRGIRRINLSEPSEETFESDEDAVVREMMAANGNTIDYSI